MSVDTTTAALAASSANARLAGTIKQASAATGASFGYLVAAAKIESNLNPNAAAPTSSARGLYQFIEQTWLGTVKEAGASFGYGRFADAISRNASGQYEVSDANARREILQLRNDPVANSAMAGVLTQSNSARLTDALGRKPVDGELYIAHFLGAGGASRLISAAENNPKADATQMFPQAASANRSIFYDRSGNARSVSQVYAELTGRYATAANSSAAQTILAAGGGAATVASRDSASFLSAFPQLGAQANAAQASASATAEFGFHSLFQTGDRNEPIASTVRELWASGRNDVNASLVSNAAPTGPTLRAPQPLDLFSDRSGQFSS